MMDSQEKTQVNEAEVEMTAAENAVTNENVENVETPEVQEVPVEETPEAPVEEAEAAKEEPVEEAPVEEVPAVEEEVPAVEEPKEEAQPEEEAPVVEEEAPAVEEEPESSDNSEVSEEPEQTEEISVDYNSSEAAESDAAPEAPFSEASNITMIDDVEEEPVKKEDDEPFDEDKAFDKTLFTPQYGVTEIVAPAVTEQTVIHAIETNSALDSILTKDFGMDVSTLKEVMHQGSNNKYGLELTDEVQKY